MKGIRLLSAYEDLHRLILMYDSTSQKNRTARGRTFLSIRPAPGFSALTYY